MEPVNIYILSVYLKKWSYGDNKFTINFSYCTNSQYERGQISLKIASPHTLASELMNVIFTEAREKLSGENTNGKVNIALVNESDARQKLTGFFSKINREYNTNKRSSGKSRMINSRSLDFYYNEYEYAPLDDDIKFFVHLNRGVNKINGDFWSNAIEDLKLALEIKADDPLVNKYLAKAFTKLKKFEIALKYLEKSVESDTNVNNLCALANAYIKNEKYNEAEEILNRIDEIEPNALYTKFTKALLSYKQGKGYKSKLDAIYKTDPEWLKEKLLKDWDFKKPNNGDGKIKWNAATAARYLDIDKPYELTKKAFNNEVPCYFNSESGIIRFVKNELDEWVELMNRYDLGDVKYSVHPERLDSSEIKRTKSKAKKTTGKKAASKKSAVVG